MNIESFYSLNHKSRDALKILITLSIAMISFTVAAEPLKQLTPSEFDIIPINSPVKESTAKFLIKTPVGFEIEELMYRIKKSNNLFEKDKRYEASKLINGAKGKELHISASTLSPGFYQLFVRIKNKKIQKAQDYQNKFKNYAMFVIDESLEVPLPNDKENSKTIAGIDTDGNGIRDDVQRWINENFSNKQEEKLAVKQVAMAIQQELINADNVELSRVATRKALDSGICLSHIVGIREGSKVKKELNSKILNTKERHYANIKVNSNFSGQSIILPDSEDYKLSCDFIM